MSRFVEPVLTDPYSFYVPIGFSQEARAIEARFQPDTNAITVIQRPLGQAKIITHQYVEITEPRATDSIQRLEEIASECSTKNWDGSREKPISSQTLSYANLLVKSLPADAPIPDIDPEPDGNINLEWRRSKDYIFSYDEETKIVSGKNNQGSYEAICHIMGDIGIGHFIADSLNH